ncbi:type II secretion system protein GspD [Longimicrobium terrae]|uniref:General secretion pathway protein D n=1 Tax=Longimicrobium terrae TaxID=1639882 RepID=A0A841H325_9BACT|nr:secretin N-terminal domain-containing protein [Longimicrobium terrae]MBB4638032.1 general secretion pathway protein D [Longimicrobium terrae]MBB6072404.1 general secretion pathway protein D [Longimicrobium terrae]NNC32182.1 hypothetical protein [Longimicrobium terrae]
MAALTSPAFRAALLGALCLASPLAAQSVSRGAQGVEVNLVQVEVSAVISSLAPYLDRPLFHAPLGNQRITFTSPRPIPPGEIPALLKNLLAEQGYLMEEVDGAYRIRPREQPQAAPQVPPPGMPQPPFGGPSLASSGGVELFVIRLRHARAADVAATVNALYGRGGALGESGLARGTLGDQLRDNRITPFGQQAPQVAAAGGSGEISGALTIVPDPRTNSLLVRAGRADFELIRAAVEQVDVRPLQVLIETTVAYVSRSFRMDLGLQATTDTIGLRGSGGSVVGRSTGGADNAALVLRALNLGGINLDLLLTAGERRQNVLIVDRPLLLAANNEEAEITVGEQRPFVQLERTTDGGAQDQVIQYKDVGTTLRVLPTISADGFVQLQVLQEVNSATGAAGLQGAPVISTRSVSTRLLVRDGRTAVLGGLSGLLRDRSSSGVPYLSRLPLIGAAFGSKGREHNDFELFIFITPHVIDSDESLEDATEDIRRNGGPAGREVDRRRPLLTPETEGAVTPASAQPVQPGATQPAVVPQAPLPVPPAQ